MDKLQFDNLAGGAIEERFNDVLQNVLDNIVDPNTDPKKTRKLTLTVTIKPNENRDVAAIDFLVVPTVAPPKPIGSTIIIDRARDGKAVANETIKSLPGQMNIQDYADPTKVIPMQQKQG